MEINVNRLNFRIWVPSFGVWVPEKGHGSREYGSLPGTHTPKSEGNGHSRSEICVLIYCKLFSVTCNWHFACQLELLDWKNMSYKIDGMVFRCPLHKGRKKSIRSGSYFEESCPSQWRWRWVEWLVKQRCNGSFQYFQSAIHSLNSGDNFMASQWCMLSTTFCSTCLTGTQSR